MKKTITWVLLALTVSATAAFAQEYQQAFNLFLVKLVERNEELKTMTMPGVEIHTVPEYENEAVYELTFAGGEQAKTFSGALEKENVPFGSFPEDPSRLMLFYSDLLRFIMKAVIGSGAGKGE